MASRPGTPLTRKPFDSTSGNDMPSNTWRFLVGLAVAFAVMLLGIGTMRAGHSDAGRTLALSGFSLVFLAQALAQLTTGYSWKNLAKGNRGPSRAESPSRYWAAVGVDILLFIGISGYAVWQWL